MREYSFVFFVNIFLARWKWIFLTALVAAAATFCINKFFLRPVYEASTSLYCGRIINEDGRGGDGVRDTTSDYTASLSIGIQLVNDYRVLLKSDRIRDMAESAVEKDPHHLRLIRPKVKVDSARQTRLLTISVESTDPVMSQKLAEAYANVFISEVQRIMLMQNSQIIDHSPIPNPHY